MNRSQLHAKQRAKRCHNDQMAATPKHSRRTHWSTATEALQPAIWGPAGQSSDRFNGTARRAAQEIRLPPFPEESTNTPGRRVSTNAPQMPPPVGPCSLPGPPAAVPACEQGSRSARAADGSGGANPTRAAKRERTHLAVRRFPRSEPAASTACGRYSCVLPSCTWKAGTIRGSPGGGNLVEIFRGGGSPAGSGRADFLPALFYFDSRTAPGCALTAPAPPPPRGHPCPGPRRTSLCREGARRALTSRREAARGGRSPPRDPTAGPLRGLHWAGRAAPLGDLRSFPAPAHGERFAPEPPRPGPGPARRARTREGTTGGPSSPPRGLPRPARAPRPDPTDGRREGGRESPRVGENDKRP